VQWSFKCAFFSSVFHSSLLSRLCLRCCNMQTTVREALYCGYSFVCLNPFIAKPSPAGCGEICMPNVRSSKCWK
jgi:hypothetical protein